MSVLRDASIVDLVEDGLIDPFTVGQLQPASYDLKLGALEGFNTKHVILGPQQFMLGSTLERVRIPDNIVGRLEGKSSLARQGLIIHTAGFIDPGFRGQLVLEITNLSGKPVMLEIGQLIAQIAFFEMDGPVERPYGHPDLGSHYQDQEGPTPSAL